MTLDRSAVLEALRAEDVVQHYSIPGRWQGRWLRSTRCTTADHTSEAFGIARDGHWHCWACDKGGDILKLIAVAEGLDMRADFSRILDAAGKIAGLDEGFGGRVRPDRPPLPPVASLSERIKTARKRAAWVWGRLIEDFGAGDRRSISCLYLEDRKVDAMAASLIDPWRQTPMRCTMEEVARSGDMKAQAYLFAAPGIAVPVRHVVDGELVDVRVRRFEPRDGQPKIVGMLGGVTAGPAEGGRPRQLIGCYGHPEVIDPGPSRLVVVVEGLMDYLTALCAWPAAQILGAVEAGSLALVAAHAARGLSDYPGGRLIIVEQADPDRILNDGAVVAGAADAAVNEDPNAASKVAMRIMGPKRVGWLFCGVSENLIAGQVGVVCKDLNDLVRLGIDPNIQVRWDQ